MRAVLVLPVVFAALAPSGGMSADGQAMGEPVEFTATLDSGPTIVRHDLTASSAGADRKYVRAVRDLVEDRLDIDALQPGTPVTIWTVSSSPSADDDVVAFMVEGKFAAKVQDKGGAERWVFDDGTTLDGPFLSRPVRYLAVASRIGVREHPVTHKIKWHAGTDYAAPIGTPVRAAADGVVTKWTRSWAGGKMLVIKHDNGFETKYLHLDDKMPDIAEGVRVHEGQQIAFVGKTGRVTGPHLHFEVRDRWYTPLDSVVSRWPAAERVSAAEVEALRIRRDLLLTIEPDGTADMQSPLRQPPSSVAPFTPPSDDVVAAVVLPAIVSKKTELKARALHRRRVRVMSPLFDDDGEKPLVHDGLTRRAMQLAAEFPEDPVVA